MILINMNIVQKLLQMECNVITPEQLPTEKIERGRKTT